MPRSRLLVSIAGAVALALTAGAVVARDVPANIAAALADPARPDKDKARDAARHSAELLVLGEVKPGDKVGDYIIGGGYFTRLFAKAVGDTGKVYAVQPAEFIAFSAQYGTNLDTVAAAYPNVVPMKPSLVAGLSFPEKLDLVFTAQNYHDLHLRNPTTAQMVGLNKQIFDSLKPGGVFLVIDHYAVDGTGDTQTSKLHRIDIATVKSEITAAGFVLETESPLLRNPADPRTVSVFDQSIQGKTDQFVLKFRKPK